MKIRFIGPRIDEGVTKAIGHLRIVDENIDIPPSFRQICDEATDILRIANIKLHREYFDALADLLRDLRGQFVQ